MSDNFHRLCDKQHINRLIEGIESNRIESVDHTSSLIAYSMRVLCILIYMYAHRTHPFIFNTNII